MIFPEGGEKMKTYAPDFYKDFHCLADKCPDSCCRQGWQIPVDDAHAEYYRTLPGALGEKVRADLIEADGELCLKQEGGVCALLEENGLCPLVREYGEDALCRICHTHPRFYEQYGGTEEVHLSLSCPEAARLALCRTAPICYEVRADDRPVETMNTINPDEYFFLLRVRKFSLALAQHRALPFSDRLTLLLLLAQKAQRLMEEEKYELCKPLIRRFLSPGYRRKKLLFTRRLRKAGTSFLPEVTLLRSMEQLTGQLPPLLKQALFCVKQSREFDEANEALLENLLVQYLAHYIPKAVNDGRVDTKIYLSALLTLTVRRLCICTGAYEKAADYAGILAKDLEHSAENMEKLYAALQVPGWGEHLIAEIGI